MRARQMSELHEQVEQTRQASNVGQAGSALVGAHGLPRAAEALSELLLREVERLAQIDEIPTEQSSERGAIVLFVHGSKANGSQTI